MTTVITGPGSANPIGGQLAAIKTAGRCIDKMIVKAPVAMKMALGENPKTVYHGKNQTPVTRMATAALIREQLRKAERYLTTQSGRWRKRISTRRSTISSVKHCCPSFAGKFPHTSTAIGQTTFSPPSALQRNSSWTM